MPTISSELYSVDTLQILPAEDAFVQGHFLMPEENGQVQTFSDAWRKRAGPDIF